VATISVVIPCYNAEAFIGEALQSVREQTRQPLEVLVTDDRSTDGSVEVIRSFQEVRLLENPVNLGHGPARNRALREARGDLIAFLDADDVWLPRHLETVAAMLEAHPRAAVAFSAVEHFGSRTGVWLVDLPEGEPTDAFWLCLRATCVPQMSAVVRRDVIGSVGGYRQLSPVAPDYDLWLRISRLHPFVYSRRVTARYRWHPSQISHTDDAQVEAVYHYRWNFLRELQREEGQGELCRRVLAESRHCWIRDYVNAFRDRDPARLRLLDQLRGRYLPSMRRPLPVLVRSLIPVPLMRGMDRVTRRPAPPDRR